MKVSITKKRQRPSTHIHIGPRGTGTKLQRNNTNQFCIEYSSPFICSHRLTVYIGLTDEEAYHEQVILDIPVTSSVWSEVTLLHKSQLVLTVHTHHQHIGPTPRDPVKCNVFPGAHPPHFLVDTVLNLGPAAVLKSIFQRSIFPATR